MLHLLLCLRQVTSIYFHLSAPTDLLTNAYVGGIKRGRSPSLSHGPGRPPKVCDQTTTVVSATEPSSTPSERAEYEAEHSFKRGRGRPPKFSHSHPHITPSHAANGKHQASSSASKNSAPRALPSPTSSPLASPRGGNQSHGNGTSGDDPSVKNRVPSALWVETTASDDRVADDPKADTKAAGMGGSGRRRNGAPSPRGTAAASQNNNTSASAGSGANAAGVVDSSKASKSPRSPRNLPHAFKSLSPPASTS